MAKVVKIVDDISGAPDAKERWAAICDGSKVFLVSIDLVDRNYTAMDKAFKDALSRWSVTGQSTVVKVEELAQYLPGFKAPLTVAEVEQTYQEPESGSDYDSATEAKYGVKPEPEATKPVKTARRRHTPEADKAVARGAITNPYYLNRTKRPGFQAWWQRNWEILQLPPFRKGRPDKQVEAAFDRYNGQDVTEDSLLPEDLARLTEPNKEE